MGDDSLDYAEGLQVSGEFKRRIRHWTDMRDGIKEQGAPMSCIFNPRKYLSSQLRMILLKKKQ